MSILGKKTIIPATVRRRLVIFVLGICCALLGWSVVERVMIERDMADRRVGVELQRQQLQERKEVLEAKVEYLSNERGVEAEIRKHFDVAKEGEQVVVILEDEQPTPEPVVGPVSEPEPSFWSRIWPLW